MATIVHRRLVRLPVPEPRGPGASLSALTWVGWVSLIAAVAWFGNGMLPVLDMGDILAGAPWILLVVAFLAGLGRSRVRRDPPLRRMRRFIRNPTD